MNRVIDIMEGFILRFPRVGAVFIGFPILLVFTAIDFVEVIRRKQSLDLCWHMFKHRGVKLLRVLTMGRKHKKGK